MKEKIKKIINRRDWSFTDFLKKYWWIELLALVKILSKIDDWILNISVILGILLLLWILYRLGLK